MNHKIVLIYDLEQDLADVEFFDDKEECIDRFRELATQLFSDANPIIVYDEAMDAHKVVKLERYNNEELMEVESLY